MSNQRLRIGIIGAGNIGCVHIQNILAGKCPDLTVTAAADAYSGREAYLQQLCESYHAPKLAFFTDAVSMLDSGLIDGCIICTPPYDHPHYAIECMKRGIHVMVEKPAGVYVRQIGEMNEQAKLHPEVVFGMMFVQRTNHLYRKMYELVKSGRYGAIRRTNWIVTNWYRSACYYESGGWRATWAGEGGGVLVNQAPHNLDLWQWICGMPCKVDCRMGFGKWHDIEVEDDVTAYVEYENGATGVFVTSTGDAHGTNRFEIQMDKAKLVMENDRLRLWEFETTEQAFSASNKIPFAAVPAKEVEVVTDGKNEQHIGVLNAWAGAILRGEKLVAQGEEGIDSMMLSNAMHLSAWLKKEVSLPLDQELHYAELMKRVKTSRVKQNVVSAVADLSDSYGKT